MKTALQFFSALMFFAVFNGFAYANMESKTVYEHLLEVNAQWHYYPDAAPNISPNLACDNQRIQTHLQLVEKHLREHIPQGFSDMALRNRMQLLDVLHEYHETAIFPTNTRHAHRQPYFIDDYGVYCAVGYLISKSGHDALAQEIHEKQNYAYIKEITVEGVAKWAATHGFTIDELAWIQPGYMATTSFAPIGDGTNAPVEGLYSYVNGMIFTGSFTQVDGFPCAHIGRYQDGNLSCVGNGIDGTVNDIGYRYDDVSQSIHLYAGGDFIHNGQSYPMAYYDNNTWHYISLPLVINARVEAMRNLGDGWLVAVSSPAWVNKQEIWQLSGNFMWSKKATVDGVVKDIEGYASGHVIAGAFDQFTVHTNNGDVVHPTNNVAFVPYQSDDWVSLQSVYISDTVLAIKYVGNALYFAGSCSPGGNEVCLTRLYNQTLQPLITPADMGDITNAKNIHTIDFYNNTHLLVGGEFTINGLMYSGQNLALFDLAYHILMPHAVLNDKVTGVAKVNNEWLVGGHFTENWTTSNLNHLAKITVSILSVDELEGAGALSLYPNPATDHVTVETDRKISQLSVVDISGKVVSRQNMAVGNATGQYQSDVSTLKPGIYIMVAEHAEGGRSQTKFVVK